MPFSLFTPFAVFAVEADMSVDDEALAFETERGGSEAVDSAAVMDAAGGRMVTFLDFGFFAGGLRERRR